MKKDNNVDDDFGLPQKVIQDSVQMHNKEPNPSLEDRRSKIIHIARNRGKSRFQKGGYIALLAAAAIFIGIIYFPTTEVTSPLSPQANLETEIESWLSQQYALGEEPMEHLLFSKEDGITDINFTPTMELSEEEFDILIQEWTIELTENEIYNFKNI